MRSGRVHLPVGTAMWTAGDCGSVWPCVAWVGAATSFIREYRPGLLAGLTYELCIAVLLSIVYGLSTWHLSSSRPTQGGLISTEASQPWPDRQGVQQEHSATHLNLQAAHVGVSLCEAEASVAAPLTSRRPSITCMLHVLTEGRGTIITTFSLFQFMIVYAIVQVVAANIMLSFGLIIGNNQYLIQVGHPGGGWAGCACRHACCTVAPLLLKVTCMYACFIQAGSCMVTGCVCRT